jgi:hypothetical protein
VSGKSRMKKPRRLVIGIYLDDEVADAAEIAVQAYDKVRLELERTRPRRLAEYAAAGQDPADALHNVQEEDIEGLLTLTQELDAARAALDEATTWFVFEAIGYRRLKKMAELHPATEEQRSAATEQGQQVEWDPDTFLPALVADSCVAPAGFDWAQAWGTDPDGDELPAKNPWSRADLEALTATALAANQTLRTADRDRRPSLTALTGQG